MAALIQNEYLASYILLHIFNKLEQLSLRSVLQCEWTSNFPSPPQRTPFWTWAPQEVAMATRSCGSRIIRLPNRKALLVGSLVWLLAGVGAAQLAEQLPDASIPQLLAQADQPQAPPQTPPADDATITVPAGARLQLVLTHPVNSNSSSQGDAIFAETSAPVIVSDRVVIPGGTYVQGKVQKLTRKGTRAEMLMQTVSLVFPNGYIAQAGGPVNVESEEWTAWNNPEGRSRVAIVLAPLLGSGLGMAIGAAIDKPHTNTLGGPGSVPPGFPTVPTVTFTENSHKGLMIGGAVGGAVGVITAFTLIARNHQFYIQEGSPMSMTLPRAITLTRAQVDEANEKAAAHPAPLTRSRPPVIVSNTTNNDICYFPGSPGTPGTHIPGTPGANGSPGTPDIDIPGTPPTPPSPYPCP